jgi:alkaline phosphatase D
MPIREDLQTLTPRIYRTFRFGNLATLFMLDTRIVGRDQEVDRKDVAALASPARSLLGAAQENWLAREFANRCATTRRGTCSASRSCSRSSRRRAP